MGDNWRDAPIAIFWDVQSTHIGRWTDALQIVANVCRVLDENHFRGGITLVAYAPRNGGLDDFNRTLLEEMNVMNYVEEVMIEEEMIGAIRRLKVANTQPANIFIASGDQGFYDVMRELKIGNNNILVASRHITRNGPIGEPLNTIADVVWNWDELCRGDAPLKNDLI